MSLKEKSYIDVIATNVLQTLRIYAPSLKAALGRTHRRARFYAN
jgi:hypothetical protein